MRFVSKSVDGYTLFAVSGTNTVSFGIDYKSADTTGLLGFAVEREDPTENERYFVYGMKVFASVIPAPTEETLVTTFNHPIQSFVWDDFTCKPSRRYTYRFYPLKGKPKNIDRSADPIVIVVETEPLFTTDRDDVFFNRGVASSQAYVRRFQNQRPDQITDPDKRAEALQWLSRDLDEAMLRFIDAAKPGDTLLGCFYEFRYEPVALALKAAHDRAVKVRLILDGKINEFTDSDGFHPSFPRIENRKMVAHVGLPDDTIALWREANSDDIQHNKFMVLLRGANETPADVWTGSTNLSMGGVHGQTNVGHWVRNAAVAARFRDYWTLLSNDPGAQDGETRAERTADRKALREAVDDLEAVPPKWADIPAGTSTVFSPRTGLDVLKMYVATLDEAHELACVTLAFGINKLFKTQLVQHTAASPVTFILLEKRDKPNPRANDPFVPLTAKHNIYQAWGAFLRDPLYQWARETNAMALQLNQHVSYIHSKFLLKDPLGADPIVITGSANFSDASTNGNDENMLLVRGDERIADIYFTEFNRLFFHYYFRSVQEMFFHRDSEAGTSTPNASLFLDETGAWLEKYRPGSLKAKRVEVFTAMANPRLL